MILWFYKSVKSPHSSVGLPCLHSSWHRALSFVWMLLTRRHGSEKIKKNSECRWHRGKKYWIANKKLHLLHWLVFPSNHFPSPFPFTQLQDRNNNTYWNTREIHHKCGYTSRHVTVRKFQCGQIWVHTMLTWF